MEHYRDDCGGVVAVEPLLRPGNAQGGEIMTIADNIALTRRLVEDVINGRQLQLID
jgi:hypothetical protein